MTTYTVTRKDTGQEVYRYSADVPISWNGMEFATHDHTTVIEEAPAVVPPQAARRLTKLGFIGRIGADFAAILSASKVNVEVELFVRMLDWATPEPDGTAVDLDDARVIGALQALEAAGLLGTGRAQEILNV